jgi:hypothetical protein
VSDLLPPDKPAMTVEVAARQRVKMLGDAGFRDRVVAGDAESLRLWRLVNRTLFNPPVDKATAESKAHADRLDSFAYFRCKADLPAEVWDYAAANGPVLISEREWALQAKERLFRDKGWVRGYLDGDRQAAADLTRIHLILAAPIADEKEVEAAKAAAAKRMNGNGKGNR